MLSKNGTSLLVYFFIYMINLKHDYNCDLKSLLLLSFKYSDILLPFYRNTIVSLFTNSNIYINKRQNHREPHTETCFHIYGNVFSHTETHSNQSCEYLSHDIIVFVYERVFRIRFFGIM